MGAETRAPPTMGTRPIMAGSIAMTTTHVFEDVAEPFKDLRHPACLLQKTAEKEDGNPCSEHEEGFAVNGSGDDIPYDLLYRKVKEESQQKRRDQKTPSKVDPPEGKHQDETENNSNLDQFRHRRPNSDFSSSSSAFTSANRFNHRGS